MALPSSTATSNLDGPRAVTFKACRELSAEATGLAVIGTDKGRQIIAVKALNNKPGFDTVLRVEKDADWETKDPGAAAIYEQNLAQNAKLIEDHTQRMLKRPNTLPAATLTALHIQKARNATELMMARADILRGLGFDHCGKIVLSYRYRVQQTIRSFGQAASNQVIGWKVTLSDPRATTCEACFGAPAAYSLPILQQLCPSDEVKAALIALDLKLEIRTYTPAA